MRIDRETDWPLSADISQTFGTKLTQALTECDAVLLSDYGSGLVTPELADAIRAVLQKRFPKRTIPGRGRQPLPSARLPRPHRVHAKPVGSRGRTPASRSTMTWTHISERDGRCCAARACRPCSSRAVVTAWRSSKRNAPDAARADLRIVTKSQT